MADRPPSPVPGGSSSPSSTFPPHNSPPASPIDQQPSSSSTVPASTSEPMPSVISPIPHSMHSHLLDRPTPMSRTESLQSEASGRDWLPGSLVSPLITPVMTPGTQTPSSFEFGPKGVPVEPQPAPKALMKELPKVECVVRARIPTTQGSEIFLHLYTNNMDNKEHLAIVFGDQIRSKSLDAVRPGETEFDRMVRGAYTGRLRPGRTSSRFDDSPHNSPSLPPTSIPAPSSASPSDAPLVRIHSECYTGETAWSARCDCGEQLDEAARLMSISPTGGAVVYLRQEGRGIGLGEKLKAYNLQDLGNDTVQANLLLRHPADARSYGMATAILMDLGLKEVRLLTNNPDKIAAVEGPGKEVIVKERVPMVPLAWRGLKGGVTGKEVGEYLKTKITQMGHLLPMPDNLQQ